jgi:6-phosphogluconolactonase
MTFPMGFARRWNRKMTEPSCPTASSEVAIRVEADTAAAALCAARLFRDTVRAAAAEAGWATVAVSGGATPRAMHRLLAEPPLSEDIPWARMHLFWADERLVPYEDAASNFGAAREDWLAALQHPPAGVHPVPVCGTPAELARRYEEELREHFRQRRLNAPVFDLVLLGLGADGHTASLLPGSRAVEELQRWTTAVKGGDPPAWRVSLTRAVLNRTRHIVFLVTGAAKSAAVRHVLAGMAPPLPAQRVRPLAGRTTWVLDAAAASRIEDFTHPTEKGAGACRKF